MGFTEPISWPSAERYERISFEFILIVYFIFNNAWERNVHRRAGCGPGNTSSDRLYRGTSIVFLHGIISPSEPNLNYRQGLYSSFR